jgi:hypothetical protein
MQWSHGTVFFSHNKSANSTFQPGFSAKQTGPSDMTVGAECAEIENMTLFVPNAYNIMNFRYGLCCLHMYGMDTDSTDNVSS